MSRFFIFALFIAFLTSCCISAFCQTNPSESITITTYYPSPYGVYREIRSKRMAIGENYRDPSQYCWEDTCTNIISSKRDLVVEGAVGIGSISAPDYKLAICDAHTVNELGQDMSALLIYNPRRRSYSAVRLSAGDSGTVQNWALTAHSSDFSGGYFSLVEMLGSGTGQLRLVAKPGGNIGIGTKNPQAKLHVSGMIRGQLQCRVVQGPWAKTVSHAYCAADEYVISGGGQCRTPEQDGFLHASVPIGLNGWAADCYSYNWIPPDIDAKAFAICCKKN